MHGDGGRDSRQQERERGQQPEEGKPPRQGEVGMGWDGQDRDVLTDWLYGDGGWDPSQSHPKPPRVRHGTELCRGAGSIN